jgi:DNA processing protein
MDKENARALLHLLAAGGATAPRRCLLEAHGTAAAAIAAGARAWHACGLDADQRRRLAAPADEATWPALEWLAGAGRRLLGWEDPDYPALLRHAPNPPLALFVAGNPALLWHPAIAVVGSRSPSAGGREHATRFALGLGSCGLAVTSGLAAGIDTAAHEGALAAGTPTIAVLGTGTDVAYPAANAGLLGRVAAAGAVVSEHPPGTPARREHFPSRNRIIAGLSLGTLVIEAAARSGALITARLAAEAGREVFALPGSIDNPKARGCHRLLRDGAALVEAPEEVVEALRPLALCLGAALRSRLGAPSSGVGHAAAAPPLAAVTRGPVHKGLWDAIGHDPTSMDQLVERTGLTAAELGSMLLIMELEGRVTVEHGRYSRKSFHHASSGAGRGK